ncbi:MAG: hypothetical protein K1X29_06075 [Bdellovibrionales bacterium]|nr:hypothetical protein [Bdellovibrionales bacterium]
MKPKLLSFIIMCSALIFCPAVMARWTGSLSNKQVEAATREACSNLPDLKPGTAIVDSLRAGLFPSPKFTDLLSYIQKSAQQKFNDSLTEIDLNHLFENGDASIVVLNSDGYQNALNSCYGDQKAPKEIFHMAILKADLRGKIITGFTLVGALAATWKLFLFLPSTIRFIIDSVILLFMAGGLSDIYQTRAAQEALAKELQFICSEPTYKPDEPKFMTYKCLEWVKENCTRSGYHDITLECLRNFS